MSSSRAIIKSLYAIGSTTALSPAKVSGSMGADILGPVITLDKIDQIGIQVKWVSSNAVGVISVQGSNDPLAATDPTNAQFDDLTFSPALSQPASNNGQYMINLGMIPFTYLRVKYTRTSGTGTLTSYISAKGL